MVEVRELGPEESAPEGAAWVLIDKEDGKFKVSGQAAGTDRPVFFSRPGFASAEEAMKASIAWADLLAVQILYVRGVREGENEQ